MSKTELQCLMVGKAFKDYPGLSNMLRQLDIGHISLKEINANQASIKQALKHLQGATLVFVPAQLLANRRNNNASPGITLQLLADLIWQHASDAMIVVLDDKANEADKTIRQVSSVNHVNNVQISHLHFVNNLAKNNKQIPQRDLLAARETRLRLQFLLHMALLKNDFRQCKRLLGISEKRCQWLVDSSIVPIAFISRDIHLYANAAYLDLFAIESLQSLRSIAVKELIVDEERGVFDSFIRSHLHHQQQGSNDKQSLFLHMKDRHGNIVKSNIRLTASVFQGKRCIQLWVHALDGKNERQSEIAKIWKQNNTAELAAESHVKTDNAMSADAKKSLFNKPGEAQQPVQSSAVKPGLILKEIIRRKEAQIFTQKLLTLNPINTHTSRNDGQPDNHLDYYLISLQVPYAQRRAVDELLTRVSHENIDSLRSLFWDKVKITRLLQILFKKKNQNLRLLVHISESSIRYSKQVLWLQKGLKKLGLKASMITFLLPSRLDDAGQRACVRFIERLKPYGCEFALDNFFVNPESLMLLKHARPEALRFSLPWLQQIEGNEQREIALSRLIRQLEARGIKTIMPCNFSQSMKRLFLLSGASFCQEKTSKGV